MGGFFGAVSRREIVYDTFFGTDYHSHLGTKRGGMAVYNSAVGIQREIHNIENTPFRTKFENDAAELHGYSAIGCISDTDPQPMLFRSHLGTYAICMVGIINNTDSLVQEFLSAHAHFEAMGGGRINQVELAAMLINEQPTFTEGIAYAQERIQGTASLLILTDRGEVIAARDKLGRLPVVLGKDPYGWSVTFESFALEKLGYQLFRELGPGEIVRLNQDGVEVLKAPGSEMRVCTFLWTYYGYPTSRYEGRNVELSRNVNGRLLAARERTLGTMPQVDYVAGVPDSGTAHALGYAAESGMPYGRPFIKYTPTWPRSFMPQNQDTRKHIAHMKLVPIRELIEGKKLLFVDDSIVRGTQLSGTVNYLYENGAREIHMRSACPPILYGCKFLNFSRSTSEMELIARRTVLELEGDAGNDHLTDYADGTTPRGKAMRQRIADNMGFASLEYQSLEGVMASTGLEPCKLCTYCWTGKE